MFGKVGSIYRSKERRGRAQEVSAFKALVATPASLGSCGVGASLTAFRLPANATLGISLNAITTNAHISTTCSNGKTLASQGGASGLFQKLGWYERSRTITINRLSGCPAGTLTLYVLDEWNRRKVIATGVFT